MLISESLLTPQSILQREEIEKPYLIFPEDFKSFDDLLKVRELIRDLRLLPIKSDEMQKYYHSFDKNHLLETIKFDNSNLLFLKNQFPYMLPNDVEQHIIWIKERTSQEEVVKFIDNKCIELFENNNSFQPILFERPFGMKTKLVKPSFPFIRHIHFLFKKL
jgi:hypothetical protein